MRASIRIEGRRVVSFVSCYWCGKDIEGEFIYLDGDRSRPVHLECAKPKPRAKEPE